MFKRWIFSQYPSVVQSQHSCMQRSLNYVEIVYARSSDSCLSEILTTPVRTIHSHCLATGLVFSESDGHRVSSSSVFVTLFQPFLHLLILYSVNRRQHWYLLLSSGAQGSCISTATLLIPEALKTCPVTDIIGLSNNV